MLLFINIYLLIIVNLNSLNRPNLNRLNSDSMNSSNVDIASAITSGVTTPLPIINDATNNQNSNVKYRPFMLQTDGAILQGTKDIINK